MAAVNIALMYLFDFDFDVHVQILKFSPMRISSLLKIFCRNFVVKFTFTLLSLLKIDMSGTISSKMVHEHNLSQSVKKS
jgi:hypothetical protein